VNTYYIGQLAQVLERISHCEAVWSPMEKYDKQFLVDMFIEAFHFTRVKGNFVKYNYLSVIMITASDMFRFITISDTLAIFRSSAGNL
jgi:hypothetical protein